MTTLYPAAIDPPTTYQDLIDRPYAAHLNQAYERIRKIQQVLGINPQGAYATVIARLAAAPSEIYTLFAPVPYAPEYDLTFLLTPSIYTETPTWMDRFETFTGTANDNITDAWTGWTTDGVNSGIEDARTTPYQGTYSICLRPSAAAPINSYGRIFTGLKIIGTSVKFCFRRNEAGSNSWSRFRLLNPDNSTHDSWDLTQSDAWVDQTIDVSAHAGDSLRLCLEAGTNVAAAGYGTLFDYIRTF